MTADVILWSQPTVEVTVALPHDSEFLVLAQSALPEVFFVDDVGVPAKFFELGEEEPCWNDQRNRGGAIYKETLTQYVQSLLTEPVSGSISMTLNSSALC